MIKNTLKKLNLTDGEIQVYLATLKTGEESAGKISKLSGIASSKVYSVLHRLEKKGLVSHIKKNGVRRYKATSPQRLVDFIQGQQEELEKVKEEVENILPELERKTIPETNVEVYSGKKGPEIILNEAIDAGKDGATLFGYGSDTDPYIKHLQPKLEAHFRKQKKHNVKWKLLFAEGFKSPNTNAEIRYLPKGMQAPTRTIIYGDVVAIIDFTKPITTIRIQNPSVAENHKAHFNYLWEQAKK